MVVVDSTCRHWAGNEPAILSVSDSTHVWLVKSALSLTCHDLEDLHGCLCLDWPAKFHIKADGTISDHDWWRHFGAMNHAAQFFYMIPRNESCLKLSFINTYLLANVHLMKVSVVFLSIFWLLSQYSTYIATSKSIARLSAWMKNCTPSHHTPLRAYLNILHNVFRSLKLYFHQLDINSFSQHILLYSFVLFLILFKIHTCMKGHFLCVFFKPKNYRIHCRRSKIFRTCFSPKRKIHCITKYYYKNAVCTVH